MKSVCWFMSRITTARFLTCSNFPFFFTSLFLRGLKMGEGSIFDTVEATYFSYSFWLDLANSFIFCSFFYATILRSALLILLLNSALDCELIFTPEPPVFNLFLRPEGLTMFIESICCLSSSMSSSSSKSQPSESSCKESELLWPFELIWEILEVPASAMRESLTCLPLEMAVDECFPPEAFGFC